MFWQNNNDSKWESNTHFWNADELLRVVHYSHNCSWKLINKCESLSTLWTLDAFRYCPNIINYRLAWFSSMVGGANNAQNLADNTYKVAIFFAYTSVSAACHLDVNIFWIYNIFFRIKNKKVFQTNKYFFKFTIFVSFSCRIENNKLYSWMNKIKL